MPEAEQVLKAYRDEKQCSHSSEFIFSITFYFCKCISICIYVGLKYF